MCVLQYRGPPVAYIQQVLVKAAVSPWDSSLVPVDVFRSPLGRAFSLLEEIRNHIHSDRYSCFRVCVHHFPSKHINLRQIPTST